MPRMSSLCLEIYIFSSSGIEDPVNYPEYVLAIHSSKRLIVEQLLPPAYILADSIISLTLAKGQRHEVSFCINYY